ncbi:hypothetical protein ACHAWF_006835 [Thalassiosira exigua]
MLRFRTRLHAVPRPFQRVAILILGSAAASLLLSLDGTGGGWNGGWNHGAFDGGGTGVLRLRSSASATPRGTTLEEDRLARFATLQPPDDVDPSVEERARSNDDPRRCARTLLYLPDKYAFNGQGSQINAYLWSSTAATYLDRAMVLVEPPPGSEDGYAGGSQFGCPADAFEEDGTTTRGDFPRGFERMVRHPAWLSRGCGVPCGETRAYEDWVRIADDHVWGQDFEEVTCRNPDGTESNVVVLGDRERRTHFQYRAPIMTSRPSPQAQKWASNLGATREEAEDFSEMRDPSEIWDYVLALMNRSGFLPLQPWIARDVGNLLAAYDLPLDREFSAIHVRRGDKLATEAAREVAAFWKSKGHKDKAHLPTNYVPFEHYLNKWDDAASCRGGDGEMHVVEHNVYVATDDPKEVRKEILALPGRIDERTVLWRACHKLSFFFAPEGDGVFHLNGEITGLKTLAKDREAKKGDCRERYRRNVASVADMMLLARARTFIGEFNSNWGRVVRTLRVRLNDAPGEGGGGSGPTRTMDTRVAWGSHVVHVPGW